MQIPPIDVTRFTLRALRTLDDARRAVDGAWRSIFPDPKAPPKEPDRSRPDIW